MKKTLLFLIAAICCLAGYADVPMRKMLEQGKTWTYVYHHFVYDSTIGNGDEFLDHETWYSYYQIEGEVEIDGHLYMKMYRWDDQNGEKSYYGAFREDKDGKVYMYGYQGEKKDFMILDFSLQYDKDYSSDVVPIVETIKENGQLFRRYRYQGTRPDGSFYDLGIISVEGVGFQGEGLVHYIFEKKPDRICDYEELAYVNGRGFYFSASAFSAPKEIELTEGERQLIASNNDFAFNLFRKVRGETSSIVSPLSITYALGMMNNGATGKTQQEINETLGFGEAGADAINSFCKKMLAESGTLDTKTKALISNTIFVNERRGYHLRDAFVEKANEFYNAQPQTRDFNDGQTMDVINKWASDHTEGMITKVLDESSFNPWAVSYLLNALYFKGVWSEPFDVAETKEESFGDGSVVPMMHKSYAEFEYTENALYQAVVLPYGNGAYRMTIFLPREGKTVGDVLDALDGNNWQVKTSLYNVDLKLPRFETENNINLVSPMSALGMPTAFMMGTAEFPNFCDGNIFISNMFQVAKIKLDEQGTEAAAVTVIEVCEGMMPEADFHATRPFLYIISEQSTGTIFFIGQYTGNVTTGDANGINEIKDEDIQDKNKAAVYDLCGRKVNSQFTIHNSQLQKGIYIQDGKKIIRK
ncbi:MAG: hypothetical protein IJ762_05510 [Bacteroidaceae bacterium]|nr:hypothetical protein [Bacteroidaceae bacterium]